MSSLEQHWDNVQPKWRHIVQHIPLQKRQRLLKRARRHLINHIDFDEVDIAVDWGCGGGLFSRELSKYTQVHMVDISAKSLEEAKKYCPKALSAIHLDVNKPPHLNCDLVFCTDVIQHFPSLRFFDNTCELWKSFNPQYIALHVKLSNQIRESTNYTKGFLRGLLLTDKHVISSFKEWQLVNKVYTYTISMEKIGFYVFKK